MADKWRWELRRTLDALGEFVAVDANTLDFADSDLARRARMGEFGRNRVVNELEWNYEAPKLLAAYADLWR